MKKDVKYSKRQNVKSSKNKSDLTKTSHIGLKNTKKRLHNKKKKTCRKNHKTNKNAHLSEPLKRKTKIDDITIQKDYKNDQNLFGGGVKAGK